MPVHSYIRVFEPHRVTRWNQLLRMAAARHPGTRVLDIGHELCPDGTFTWTVDGIQVRSDGVHLTRKACGG